MKTLKQYIRNCIENPTNESLFDDEDTFLDPKRDKVIIENWISQNYNIKGRLEVLCDDIYTVNCSKKVTIKNNDIESLTNGMFRWGKVDGGFYCNECKNLKSLEGAPKNVKDCFNCSGCKNLETLKGAPETVEGCFDCSWCKNLKTLEGSPETVEGWFSCSRCEGLKSLKGAPKEVEGDFYCYRCPNLVITDSDREKYNIRT